MLIVLIECDGLLRDMCVRVLSVCVCFVCVHFGKNYWVEERRGFGVLLPADAVYVVLMRGRG
jgi:hypothetical protein